MTVSCTGTCYRERLRQLFMRHKDVHLTLDTYDDETKYRLKNAVDALGKLDIR